MNASPSNYTPRSPSDFIGPAGKIATVLSRKASNALQTGQPIKLLLHGSPGCGKTALANMLAGTLAGHATQVESINGRNVSIETVRQWAEGMPYRAMVGGYRVIIINEGDLIQAVAQDALLSILDELPSYWCVIVTCNSRLDQITPRLQTRFQQFAIMVPSEREIAELLERFGCNGQSLRIAQSSKGNVRAALLDAQSILDCMQ